MQGTKWNGIILAQKFKSFQTLLGNRFATSLPSTGLVKSQKTTLFMYPPKTNTLRSTDAAICDTAVFVLYGLFFFFGRAPSK